MLLLVLAGNWGGGWTVFRWLHHKDDGYGNFDIILVQISRISQHHPTPARAVYSALLGADADWGLIGAWNPILWPIWGCKNQKIHHDSSTHRGPSIYDPFMQARAKKFLRQVNPKNTKKKKNSTSIDNNELYDPQNFMQTIRVSHDSSMHAQQSQLRSTPHTHSTRAQHT